MFTDITAELAVIDSQAILGATTSIQSILNEAKRAGLRSLLIDLAGFEIIDSIQIGLLFGLARQCQEDGLHLAIYGAQPAVRQSLKWVNAHRVMSIHDDRASAVASLGAIS